MRSPLLCGRSGANHHEFRITRPGLIFSPCPFGCNTIASLWERRPTACRSLNVALCNQIIHYSDKLQQSIQSRILELAEQHGVLRPRDVEAAGIPREYLLRLLKRGAVERTARGLYRMTGAPITELHSLAGVAKRVPHATVCLMSALVFHGLTTQVPHEIWLALPRGSRAPLLDGQKLRIFRFGGAALTEGRCEHRIEGVPVMIYTPAKTVADAFKFRNRIGLDVALEALRESVRERKATISEIRRFAGICRVERVMQPYLESLP
jgi:predicted transcriptional regulator of viral defense system